MAKNSFIDDLIQNMPQSIGGTGFDTPQQGGTQAPPPSLVQPQGQMGQQNLIAPPGGSPTVTSNGLWTPDMQTESRNMLHTGGAPEMRNLSAGNAPEIPIDPAGASPQTPIDPNGIRLGTTEAPSGGTITRGGEVFTTQGFGEQTSNATGMAPTGQSNDANVAARQGFEAQNAQRIAGMTPEALAAENALNNAAVNQRQIQGEEAQGLFRPSQGQIGQAQGEAVARQADYEQRQVSHRIDSEMRQFERDNHRASPEELALHRQQLIKQESLVEKPEGRTFEQGLATRKQDFDEAQAGVVKPKSPTALENKVDVMMDDLGISRSEATGIASGTTRIVTDPVSGQSQLVNMATGEARDIKTPTPSGEKDRSGAAPATPEKTLFSQTGEVTGFAPTMLNKIQGVVGQAGLKAIEPEVQEGIQMFQTEQKSLFTALKDSGRYIQGEIDMLKDELDITPGAFTDEQTLRAKMTSVRDSLQRRLINEMAASFDEDLPVTDQRNARSASKAITNFLATMGDPEDAPEGTSDSGEVSPELLGEMTPEQRKLFK